MQKFGRPVYQMIRLRKYKLGTKIHWTGRNFIGMTYLKFIHLFFNISTLYAFTMASCIQKLLIVLITRIKKINMDKGAAKNIIITGYNLRSYKN